MERGRMDHSLSFLHVRGGRSGAEGGILLQMGFIWQEKKDV